MDGMQLLYSDKCYIRFENTTKRNEDGSWYAKGYIWLCYINACMDSGTCNMIT